MFFLKQSTAVTEKIGPFIDDTDGKTAETGLTISQADVRLSKNGGNYAQKNDSDACTHDELGEYGCPLDATDTNTLGRLKLLVHESGALPVWHEYTVLTARAYDALIEGPRGEFPYSHTFYLGGPYASDDNAGHTAETAVATWPHLFNSTDGLVYDASAGPVVVYVLSDQDLIEGNIEEGEGTGTVRRANAGYTGIIGVGWPEVSLTGAGATPVCTISITSDVTEITGLRVTHSTGNGIDCMASFCYIHDNDFTNLSSTGPDITIGKNGTPITDCIVENNRIHGTEAYSTGIQCYSVGGAEQVARCIIRHNTIYNRAAAVRFYDAIDCIAYGNTIYRKHTSGDLLSIEFGSNSDRCIAVDNIFEGTAPSVSDDGTDNVFRNNLGLSVMAVGGYKSLVFTLDAWPELNGQVIAGCTSCAVTVYAADGSEAISEMTDSSDDAQGVFKVTKSSPGLTAGNAYYAEIAIVYGGHPYTRVIGFTAR